MTIEQERDIAVKALEELRGRCNTLHAEGIADATLIDEVLTAIAAQASEAAMMDAINYGTGILRDGKHVPYADLFEQASPVAQDAFTVHGTTLKGELASAHRIIKLLLDRLDEIGDGQPANDPAAQVIKKGTNMTDYKRAAQEATTPFAIWFAMSLSRAEISEGHPMPDDAIVLSFGDHTKVTAGQIHAMLDAIYECSDKHNHEV